jgi:hypothetical protein
MIGPTAQRARAAGESVAQQDPDRPITGPVGLAAGLNGGGARL